MHMCLSSECMCRLSQEFWDVANITCSSLSYCTLLYCTVLFIELQKGTPDCQSSSVAQFPETTRKYAVGMVRTTKEDFTKTLDLGVPVDLPQVGAEDVLILYSRAAAKPKHIPKSSDGSIPLLSMEDSVEHCDYLNVILTDKSASRNQCIAIVPQYESFHIQKWMRVPKTLNPKNGHETNGPLDSNAPLRLVSRGMQSNGKDQFEPPEAKHIKQNWELLQKYMSGFEESLASLKPLVEKVATKDNTVTVMVANFGQSELLVNFVCAARSRNLDTSSILVFATDNDTKELAEQLGLTAFFDERVRRTYGIENGIDFEARCAIRLTLTWSFFVCSICRILEKCQPKPPVTMVIRSLLP